MRILLIVGLILNGVYTSYAQLLPTFGNSRTGATGMQFLKIIPDARSSAMGGAVVGISNDASAMFWNPSAITQTDSAKSTYLLSHTYYTAASTLSLAAATFKLGTLRRFGIQALSMNYPKMLETTELQPYGTGRFVNLSNTLLGLTYAQILTDHFSFGLTGKWAHEAIGDVQTNMVLFDLGLTYDIGIKNARFGVAFSNFGMNVNPEGSVQMVNLSGNQIKTSFGEISAPGMFRIGGAFDPIHNPLNKLTVSMQLNHPTDNNESFAIGTEYAYRSILYGRTGWEFATDESSNLPCAGLGVQIPRNFGTFKVDYSMVNRSRMGNMHRITLIVKLF